MKEIYAPLVRLLDGGEKFALATLVRSRGSTPQQAGAQAVFFADGRTDGNLGGGCLEMEARRRALLALESGDPTYFPIHLNNDYGFDDGLICGGTAEILVEPAPRSRRVSLAACARALERQVNAGAAVLISSSNPKSTGVRVVVAAGEEPVWDGDAGSAAPYLLQHATAAAAGEMESPAYVEFPGGAAYVEPLLRSPALVVVGAGHVGTALSRLCSRLDFHVIVIDDRPSFADPDRLPWAQQVLLGDIPAVVRSLTLAPDASVVIVTRGHRHDGAALRECLGRPLAYLGMIGSRRKIKLIYDELIEEGAAESEIAAIHAPLGLDIGSQSVEEIAVSIAAELIMVRRGGTATGRPLREVSRLSPSGANCPA